MGTEEKGAIIFASPELQCPHCSEAAEEVVRPAVCSQLQKRQSQGTGNKNILTTKDKRSFELH